MLIGGIDVSGGLKEGNHVYMSIVIGTEPKVRSISKKMGPAGHMREIQSQRAKNRIISSLEFDGKEILALCVKINRDEVISNAKNRKIRKKNMARKKIIRMFNNLLLYHLRDTIGEFLVLHKCGQTDVVFQCDDDSVGFLKDNGLNHERGGGAHKIADGVAWGNNKNKVIRGVVEIDLEGVIGSDLREAMIAVLT